MRASPFPGMCGRLMACGGLACALVAALAASAQAGTITAQFPVQITLANPLFAANAAAGTFCVNQALSQASQATVTVVCSTNQFVSIQPVAGNAFVGTHDGAYRFLLKPDLLVPPGEAAGTAATRTVTTLQVYRTRQGKWEITEVEISY